MSGVSPSKLARIHSHTSGAEPGRASGPGFFFLEAAARDLKAARPIGPAIEEIIVPAHIRRTFGAASPVKFDFA